MPIGPDTDRHGAARMARAESLSIPEEDRAVGPQSWVHSGSPAALEAFLQRPIPSSANDLGDLVDPQDDTYEEEGTHGLPLLALGAAATAFGTTVGSNIGNKLTSDGGK